MKSIFLSIIIFFVFTNIAKSKEIDIIFKNPIHDSKANTHTLYTLNTLITWGNEAIFKELGSANSPALRFTEYLLNSYFSAFLTSFSHEWSHYRLAYYYNLNPSITIKPFGGLVQHNPTTNLNHEIKIVTAGVNQQEFNADFIFEKMVLNGKMNYQNGLMLLANRLGVFGYSLVTLAGYTSRGNDIITYETYTGYKGYEVNRDDMFLYSALSLVASYTFWENFYMAYHFVANNKRKKPIRILWDTVVPPLFQYYLSEYGDIFSMKLPILKPFPIFFWYGFGLHKIIQRIGVKAVLFKDYRVSLMPYYFYTEVPSGNFTGHLIGMDTSIRLYPKNWKANFTVRYNDKDIMSQLMIEDGFYFSAGTSYTF